MAHFWRYQLYFQKANIFLLFIQLWSSTWNVLTITHVETQAGDKSTCLFQWEYIQQTQNAIQWIKDMFYKNMLEIKLIINMNRQIHFKWVSLKGRYSYNKQICIICVGKIYFCIYVFMPILGHKQKLSK